MKDSLPFCSFKMFVKQYFLFLKLVFSHAQRCVENMTWMPDAQETRDVRGNTADKSKISPRICFCWTERRLILT